MINALILATSVLLNGTWNFRFEEDKALEAVASADFAATDTMVVPGCWDVMPKWYMKHGTGLYRRSFTLSEPMKDAVLVVDGMGVRSKFMIDGKDLGLQVFPYARLEIPVGPLAAGEHTIFAAVDNVMEWPRVKLARPYYDFYFYGGFYHGVKLVEKEPKVFVRTLDFAKGEIEVEFERFEGFEKFERLVVVDGKKEFRATFENGRTRISLPGLSLWSPSQPNLHTLTITSQTPQTSQTLRFGIRQIEAKNRKIYLNGKQIFLKGFNRHESEMTSGAATSDALMLQDIQRLKALGGNFIRGAHYQQSERFLDLCDEMGVLVWEESLGWGNGQGYTCKSFPPNELTDPEFCDLQVRQTREMVRASLNHPCVIISGFLNEFASSTKEGKALADRLIETIRAERSGHLVTFACSICMTDICNEKTDIVAFNTYPGGIPLKPGTPEQLAEKVRKDFTDIVAHFRKQYPDKPIMVSESGVGAVYGCHDPNASVSTEECQEEYLRDILETLWANPDVVGYSIWQMNDGRTRERFCDKSVSAFFGGSVAGVFDQMRRPKMSAKTVQSFFTDKIPANLK